MFDASFRNSRSYDAAEPYLHTSIHPYMNRQPTFPLVARPDYDGASHLPGKPGDSMSDRPFPSRTHDRREFLKVGGAVTAALLAPTALKADTAKTMPALPENPRTQEAMPTRNLGKTGYKV